MGMARGCRSRCVAAPDFGMHAVIICYRDFNKAISSKQCIRNMRKCPIELTFVRSEWEGFPNKKSERSWGNKYSESFLRI